MFGKEFFDGDKDEYGVYKSYRFEDWYPKYKLLANSIKVNFNPTKVLDVGCAKGFLVKAFEDSGIEAWGVDISEYAISKAPMDIRPKLYKIDLNKDVLPFKDEYFDFVTFIDTIEYLNNYKHAINEVKRVLRVGGGLYLKIIYKKHPRDKIRINVHDKIFWIKEFQSNGFKFVPGKLDEFEYNSKNTIKFKLGKFLYQKGGYVGKQFISLYRKFFSTKGSLFFVKEAK